MQSVTIEDAKKIKDLIVEKLNPFSIIIFGSVAKYGIGNDLDIIIVFNEDEDFQDNDKLLLIHNYLKPYYKKFPIDPFIFNLKKINNFYLKNSPFLRKIFSEGRLLYMKDVVKNWIKQAQEELDMAEYLFSGGYYKGACYHAQQSLEKSLKAKLLSKGWELEKIHSIARLVALSEDYKIEAHLSEEEIIFMDTIYRGRYPAEFGMLPMSEPSIEDAKKALEIAKKNL